MNRLLLIAGALVVLAGAFPGESVAVIAWSSQALGSVTGMVTPGQQTAIVVVAVILALAGISGKN